MYLNALLGATEVQQCMCAASSSPCTVPLWISWLLKSSEEQRNKPTLHGNAKTVKNWAQQLQGTVSNKLASYDVNVRKAQYTYRVPYIPATNNKATMTTPGEREVLILGGVQVVLLVCE